VAALAIETLAPEPRLRVGILPEVGRVSLGADEGVVVHLLDGEGQPTGKTRSVARATFMSVSLLPVTGPPAVRYRVQVGRFAAESGAQAVATRVQETVHLEAKVERSAADGTYAVRAGEFKDREAAQTLAGRLSRSGLPGAFVVGEPAAAGAFHLRLLETGEDLLGATVVPARTGDTLSADATPYRGYFEVRSVKEGTLTVVNVVHVEDYLRGVVPNELSPEAFPEAEALKAQAVAARTYALKNRGEYAFKGYDICATAACQVYKGRATEHRMTDKAVEETRGTVATWQGSYIHSFYTSTCGGHTEDGENVLEEKARPYLRGVVCAPERTAWAAIRTTSAPKSFADQDGLSRDAGLLVALGVLEPKMYASAMLSGAATEGELTLWTKRLVQSLQRRPCPVEPEAGPLVRRGHFFRHLVDSLCWQERAQRLLAPGDPEYLLHLEDQGDLAGEGERTAAALLIEEGILSPFPDNTLRPATALTRAHAVKLLARAAEKAGAPGLVTAEFHGVAEGLLTVVEGGGESERAYQLDPAVRLFRDLEGVRAAASELSLAVGDQVRYVLGETGRVAFLEGQQSRKGAAADRDSRYYRWEVRMTPAEVARAVTRYGTVDQVRDVVPRRVGVSGRVVELAVLGSRDREELVLRGLKVRFGLGLRESLFVIDRETDARGEVKRFVFTGKGWGHGVGLCQVGAFGMARSGSDYADILKHYYTGVELKTAY
jgi:stage II sporulation protein D